MLFSVHRIEVARGCRYRGADAFVGAGGGGGVNGRLCNKTEQWRWYVYWGFITSLGMDKSSTA
ncbi:hypothetical protein KCP69_03705 [Salmonella enterica subsp. enterica]|nr:hypothetical protein KCP69_03705 [Salmonella enterica subsp. enterica]